MSAQHNIEQARDAFERSATLSDRLPGIGLDRRALTQGSLGNLLTSEGRWREAVVHHQRALALREERYGPDHLLVSRSLLSLGNCYTNLPEQERAATQAYDRVLAIREATQGPHSPGLILILSSLGIHHVRHGHPARALSHLRRAQSLLDAHPQDAYRHADTKFWFGRALFESHTDAPQGLRLVDEAIVELEAIGSPALLEDARAWRASHS